MAFTSLWERSNHLANLPWVLAGPILRKVTPKSVTVWVALKETALVSLSIKDDNNKEVAKGDRSTSAIGVNLHIVAVTARPTGEDLKEGIVYHYDFLFAGPHRAADLGGATNSVSLGYGTNPLPGFALPPSDLNSVRIFHGSCRMPHGDGPDALPLLDVLIEQAASNPTARPHQLLLTGDQIYADDVSAALLMLLTDAGDALLYGDPATAKKEILPVIGAPISTLPPYWRYIPLDNAGFTSDDRINHLVSLGEYLAMYLFTWSDVLWPPDGNSTALPAKEVVDRLADSIDHGGAPPMVNTQFTYHPKREIDDHVKDVKNHYGTLFRVRRLLANIPTAMIFDDHEITDDWNMTLSFCRDIYSNQLGRRVIQNGLVAYALCQHWGNVPEDFETANLPGAALLSLLDGKNGNDYGKNSTDIQKIVGVRIHPEQRDADAKSFTYNYTIEATAYQVIVTDTRSWRTFPDGNNTTGHFLPALPSNQLDAQVTKTPALNRRALLVVLTTNAPPTEPIRTAERNPWIAKHLSGGSTHADIYDAWDLPSVAFDRLLVALTEKLLDHGVRKGAVILLSGDVHHGFSARLKYRATKRFEDASPQPASVIFAELVASSFKKQSGSTIDLHKQGYAAAKVGHGYVPPYKKEGYVGYNLPAGTAVAQRRESIGFPTMTSVDHDIKLKSASPSVIPTILLGHEGNNKRLNDEHDIRLIIKPPDFRYRLDYLEADKQGQQPLAPPSIPPFPPGMKREDAIKQFNQATNFYRDYNYKGISRQQIVGLNNIGEITFERSQSGLSFVNHTLRWKREESAEFLWANYHIYVNPDDDVVYDDVKAENE
jgi:hypothetical protein